MSMYDDLWFHLQGIDQPSVARTKLEIVFCLHNENEAHGLDNKLNILNPIDFSCI